MRIPFCSTTTKIYGKGGKLRPAGYSPNGGIIPMESDDLLERIHAEKSCDLPVILGVRRQFALVLCRNTAVLLLIPPYKKEVLLYVSIM
jgi:hypothetical protein